MKIDEVLSNGNASTPRPVSKRLREQMHTEDGMQQVVAARQSLAKMLASEGCKSKLTEIVLTRLSAKDEAVEVDIYEL